MNRIEVIEKQYRECTNWNSEIVIDGIFCWDEYQLEKECFLDWAEFPDDSTPLDLALEWEYK